MIEKKKKQLPTWFISILFLWVVCGFPGCRVEITAQGSFESGESTEPPGSASESTTSAETRVIPDTSPPPDSTKDTQTPDVAKVEISFSCKGVIEFGEVAVGKTKERSCTLVASSALLLSEAVYHDDEGSSDKPFVFIAPKLGPAQIAKEQALKIRYQPQEKQSSYTNKGAFTLRGKEITTGRPWTATLKVSGKALSTGAHLEIYPNAVACLGNQECAAFGKNYTCRKLQGALLPRCITDHPNLEHFKVTPNQSYGQTLLLRSAGQEVLRIKEISWQYKGNTGEFKVQGLPAALWPGQVLVVDGKTWPDPEHKLIFASNDRRNPARPLTIIAQQKYCSLVAEQRNIEVPYQGTFSITFTNKGNSNCIFYGAAFANPRANLQLLSPPKMGTVIPPGKALILQGKYVRTTCQVSYSLSVAVNGQWTDISLHIGGGFHCDPFYCGFRGEDFYVRHGFVPIGATKSDSFSNNLFGLSECQVNTIQISPLSPKGDASFALEKVPKLPYKGRNIKVDVSFSPKQQGIHHVGVLRLGMGSAYVKGRFGFGLSTKLLTVPLHGYSLERRWYIWEEVASQTPLQKIDFGAVNQGCQSPKRKIVIAHSPTYPVVQAKPLSMTCTGDACAIATCDLAGKCSIAPHTRPFEIHIPYPVKSLPVHGGIEVRFTPKQAGTYNTTFELKLNEAGQDYTITLALRGVSKAQAPVEETYTQSALSKWDLLFAIDTLPAMETKQAQLASQIEALLKPMLAGGADLRIGVLRTGTSSGTMGLGCLGGANSWIASMTATNATSQLPKLRKLLQPGVDTIQLESGLLLAKRALSDPMLLHHPACNHHFRRADAGLSVITLAGMRESQGYRSHRTQASEEEKWALQHITKAPWLFRFSTISAPMDLGCYLTQTSRFLRSSQRWPLTYQSGGVQIDICKPDWSAGLDAMARAHLRLRRRFRLANAAEASTIQVFVEGNQTPLSRHTNWYFDAPQNTVVFAPHVTLRKGQALRIQYTPATCP